VETRGESGFSLVEVLAALSLLVIVVCGVAPVALFAARANLTARGIDVAQQAAREKLEELRALTWAADDSGAPVQDITSDLSAFPLAPNGGPGLSASPADSLTTNRPGYCDFLDESGRWLASGTTIPANARWIRRWSVAPLAALPDTLQLQVIVSNVTWATGEAALRGARTANGAWLVDMYTRRLR
jgi:prepilin-type N-terminal cleavage/methylation domain-containing protein